MGDAPCFWVHNARLGTATDWHIMHTPDAVHGVEVTARAVLVSCVCTQFTYVMACFCAGAASLWEALEHLSDVQRLRLAQQLVELQQHQGVKLRPNTWAAQLAAEANR